MAAQDDIRWMELAVRSARQGLGRTGENPSVGCVIVRETPDGMEVLARGRTGDGGSPHGERAALAIAGARARGASLYVTLEPCSHFGKNPPCTDAIVKVGIARVVVALDDPNPLVGGEGYKRLEAAGIVVERGVLREDAAWVTAGHLLRVKENRPFVQLKLAVSSDGLIAVGDGAPQWVTGEAARGRGHLLRAQMDAILVGSGTVLADNPSLDCRLAGLERFSPMPVVLDSGLQISPAARLVENSGVRPLLVFYHDSGEPDIADRAERLTANRVELEAVGLAKEGGLDLKHVLERLAVRGVGRLLVEGGPRVAHSFYRAGLIDEAVIFRGAQPVEGEGLKPLAEFGVELFDDQDEWQAAPEFSCRGDTMMVYRSRKSLKNIGAQT